MSGSSQVGANLEQMVALTHAFQAKATQVDQLADELGTRLVGTGGAMGSVFWQGQLADRFRHEWDATYRPGLRQLAEALREQARYVDDNRRRSNLVPNGVDA